ncbi:hypothetical protein [Pseudomonas viridiflava]|uniref:hypothetical protein n=1 Tax=Pseudomonas viridiflava TaxID=33069 RepID=UPI000F03AA2C|nr:hypothetical protein [Pseudomonas viridiflava]
MTTTPHSCKILHPDAYFRLVLTSTYGDTQPRVETKRYPAKLENGVYSRYGGFTQPASEFNQIIRNDRGDTPSRMVLCLEADIPASIAMMIEDIGREIDHRLEQLQAYKALFATPPIQVDKTPAYLRQDHEKSDAQAATGTCNEL